MNLTWGFVDVRDVADAHVRAVENKAAKARYITAGEAARRACPIQQRCYGQIFFTERMRMVALTF
jgi:nucleoside-diphosphate-sugar epimerase